MSRAWQKRWVVLDGGELRFFKERTHGREEESVSLRTLQSAGDVRVECSSDGSAVHLYAGTLRVLSLRPCESDCTLQRWARSLRKIAHATSAAVVGSVSFIHTVSERETKVMTTSPRGNDCGREAITAMAAVNGSVWIAGSGGKVREYTMKRSSALTGVRVLEFDISPIRVIPVDVDVSRSKGRKEGANKGEGGETSLVSSILCISHNTIWCSIESCISVARKTKEGYASRCFSTPHTGHIQCMTVLHFAVDDASAGWALRLGVLEGAKSISRKGVTRFMGGDSNTRPRSDVQVWSGDEKGLVCCWLVQAKNSAPIFIRSFNVSAGVSRMQDVQAFDFVAIGLETGKIEAWTSAGRYAKTLAGGHDRAVTGLITREQDGEKTDAEDTELFSSAIDCTVKKWRIVSNAIWKKEREEERKRAEFERKASVWTRAKPKVKDVNSFI